MPLYRRLPKRGFKSLNKRSTAVLNLSRIQYFYEKNNNILSNPLDLKLLKEKNKIISFEKERITNRPWIYEND